MTGAARGSQPLQTNQRVSKSSVHVRDRVGADEDALDGECSAPRKIQEGRTGALAEAAALFAVMFAIREPRRLAL